MINPGEPRIPYIAWFFLIIMVDPGPYDPCLLIMSYIVPNLETKSLYLCLKM